MNLKLLAGAALAALTAASGAMAQDTGFYVGLPMALPLAKRDAFDVRRQGHHRRL